MTTFSFHDKTVLITGSSRGIGKAIATAFAQAGAQVVVHAGHDLETAEQTKNSLPGTDHLAFQADITDAAAVGNLVNEAIAALGHLDILVNNAGVYQESPLDRTDYQDWQTHWRHTLSTNLIGATNVAYCVAQHMMQRRSGRMINITSRGAFRGEPNAIAYGASKAGLNAFSQSLAQHLAPYNIFVTAVAPGFVETDMARTVLEGASGDAVRAQSPLNRVAHPEEVAHTVMFLASEGAEFLTGCIVDVNGASYLRS